MKWRIWFLTLGITLVCVLIFGFASTNVYYRSTVENSKESLKVYLNAFDEEKYTLDAAGAKAYSEQLNGARVTFTDAEGNVIADSIADGEIENHAEREEIRGAILTGEGFAVRGSSTLGKNMAYYARNFGGKFLVRAAVFLDSDWIIFVKTFPNLLGFSLIMLLAAGVIAIVATHFIIDPVKKLARDAVNNDSVSTNYSELIPVANLLNERGRNIRSKMWELEAEKNAVDNARKSKDEFISNVTHEMNTPLTSIRGYAELLNAGALSGEQKDIAYRTIMEQSDRLTNLIACIINYSEIESEDLTSCEVDFSALLKETILALKPDAEKRGVKIFESIEDNVVLISRHEYLNQIAGNLLRNAIKYNKEGGSVTVTLSYEGLTVEDTGIGIAEENQNKVFSRFFTVDKSRGGKNGGFGLGLAVVKKICDKSGWRISVESTLGVGSKFTVEF